MAKAEREYRLDDGQKILAEENFRLVYWFMEHKEVPQGIDWDDYQSYLIRWYLRSIVTFDPEKAKISTYVVKMLNWARLHYITKFVRESKRSTVSIHGLDGGDQIEFPVNDDQDKGFVEKESGNVIEELIKTIGPSREAILREYMSGVSPTKIGRRMGVSRQRISNVIEKSIAIMRVSAAQMGITNPLEISS